MYFQKHCCYIHFSKYYICFKRAFKNSKENYRPANIFPNVSKMYERPLFNQINEINFEGLFSKYECGFPQESGAYNHLIAMLEKWKNSLDKRKTFVALLTDLSKAFDCLLLDLIIAKLNAYGFSYSFLRSIHSYLSDRKQRTNKV